MTAPPRRPAPGRASRLVARWSLVAPAPIGLDRPHDPSGKVRAEAVALQGTPEQGVEFGVVAALLGHGGLLSSGGG